MKNSEKAFIGVDISKQHLDAYIRPISKHMRVENSKQGIRKLLQKLSKLNHDVGQIACESSGGYQRLMVRMLEEKRYKVWCANPALVKAFIRSEGVLVKTDAHDAKMIALFAEKKNRPYEKPPTTREFEDLQELVKRKSDITQMISSEKVRIQSPTASKECIKMIRQHIRYLEKQSTKIDLVITQRKTSNEEWKKKVEIMESIPGIGKETALNLLVFMPELGNITNKQSSALLGVAPYTRESGNYRGVGIIRGGRAVPRKMVYMAALSASRANPILKEFYCKLIAKGKRPKVALVAVMRKLVVFVNAMLSKEKSWNIDCCKIA